MNETATVLHAVQDLAARRIRVVDVPEPPCPANGVLIATEASLISSGTERSKAVVTGQNLAQKALERRDLVAQTLDKARTEGVTATARLVQERLAGMQPLGYSCAGTVVRVGSDVAGIRPGDLVAAAGEGSASHAEIVSVTSTMCAVAPGGVTAAEAAFGGVASIALHGIHRADVGLGDSVTVVGLGLVGRLTVRLLAAYGCEVEGVDGYVDHCDHESGLSGVTITQLDSWRGRESVSDSVIVCASTDDRRLLADCVERVRPHGSLVLVGIAPLEFDRATLYEREIRVSVSKSYGLGRHDPVYESDGVDYPLHLGRWTIARNLGEVLRLVGAGRLAVDDMVELRVPIAEATSGYDALVDGSAHVVLLTYDGPEPQGPSPLRPATPEDAPELAARDPRPFRSPTGRPPRVGLVGPGNFATRVLIPGLKDAGVELAGVCSGRGVSAAAVAQRHGFGAAVSSLDDLLELDLDALVVASRHASHGSLVTRGVEAGLAVFVEKPMCLDRGELQAIEMAADAGDRRPLVVPGFNRRFAPHVTELLAELDPNDPKLVEISVSAGRLPDDAWTLSASEGGRLLGEVCHFVDLARHVSPSPVVAIDTRQAGRSARSPHRLTITLGHDDGSLSTITYHEDGGRGLAKERVAVHSAGRSWIIDDFRQLRRFPRKMRPSRPGQGQDKGHSDLIGGFVASVRRGLPGPIDLADSLATHRLLFDIADRADTARPPRRTPVAG